MTDERPTEPTAPEGAPEPPPPASAPPAYTPPTYTPPPVPPPAMPQPAVAWAPPPATTATTGQRTTLSLSAGIVLVVLGILGGLLALLIVTIGREFARQFNFTNLPGFEGSGDPGAFVGSIVTFVGIVLLVFSTFYIVGGVGIIRSRNWGRVIGIVIGILAGLFWLLSLVSGGQVSDGSGRGGGGPVALVLLVIHAYVAISLLFFWRAKTPTS